MLFFCLLFEGFIPPSLWPPLPHVAVFKWGEITRRYLMFLAVGLHDVVCVWKEKYHGLISIVQPLFIYCFFWGEEKIKTLAISLLL